MTAAVGVMQARGYGGNLLAAVEAGALVKINSGFGPLLIHFQPRTDGGTATEGRLM
jgi:hypothetical protein